MARRISSIFSLGSSSSSRTESSNDSRLSASTHPSRPPRKRRSTSLAAKSTPDLRPAVNLQDLHINQSSGHTPTIIPPILPRIEDDYPLLRPSLNLSPYPVRPESQNGRRPASVGGRPRSRADDNDILGHSSTLLKPLPMSPDSPGGGSPLSAGGSPGSRPGSRPPSRPASPIKSCPPTPVTESKLGKRRSWLPTRFRAEMQQEERDGQTTQASIITPQGKLPYDTSPLANFQKVSMMPSLA